MKEKKDYRSELPLADMNVDGIPFDPLGFQALKNQTANVFVKQTSNEKNK